MPLLDQNGYRTDKFTRVSGAGITGIPAAMIALDALEAAYAMGADGQELGVEVANTTTPAALEPYLPGLALIGIAFPAYSDGRGFSLARRLRQAGFTGRLRAVGPLITDQFAYAIACGFDEIELPEANAARQPASQWAQDIAAYSSTYQRGYARGENILDQRRAARLGVSNG